MTGILEMDSNVNEPTYQINEIVKALKIVELAVYMT